jgi:hypothetical protein
MKLFLRKFLSSVLILFFLFFGLKGCVKSVYRNNEIRVFQNTTKNGEIREIYLLPKNRLIISREYRYVFDVSLFEIKGANMTHYFGSLYNSGENLFSLKIYPDVLEAFKVEIKRIDNINNIEETGFIKNDIDDVYYLLFKETSIEFSGENFNEIRIDKERYDLINTLLKKHDK